MKGANDVREDKERVQISAFMLMGRFGGIWQKLKWARYLCAITLILALLPNVAYAAGYQQGLAGVIQGPSQWYDYGDSADGGYVGYFVYAYSDFDAALYTLDYDPSQLTSEQKAKLSNASTGGKFYEYVQMFHTFGSDSEPSGWLSRDFYGQWVIIYGRDYLYWVEATNQQIVDAKSDLQKVLNGEDLGGGGSGSGGSGGTLPDDGYIVASGSPKYYNWSASDSYLLVGDKKYTVMQPDVINYGYSYITDSFKFRIPISNIPDFSYTSGYVRISFSQGVITGLFIYNEDYSVITTGVNDFGMAGTTYINNLTYNTEWYENTTSSSVRNWDIDGLTFTYNGGNLWKQSTSGNYVTYSGNSNILIPFEIEESEQVIPPTNWPTDPTPTPVEPPEVPEPPTTTPPTQPTPPTSPTPPTYQPQPVYVTSNFTVDLQGILDAMDEHCQHIQNALYQQSKNLYEDLTTYLSDKYADLKLMLDGNFGYIGETIDDGLEDLKDYLWELFSWLKDNMEFSFTAPEYDDSSVLSWLKKIYSKMGTGIRSKPVDPVVDPVGAWNWLEQLIQGILGALSNAVGGLTGTVGELFNGIKDKFPFSIPWDLAAILALFDAAPVTPQATIDYTIFEDGPVAIPVHWDINMHYLDDTMGTVRAMEDIVFCFYLLMKTDWLSSFFDGIGEYLGGRYRAALRS